MAITTQSMTAIRKPSPLRLSRLAGCSVLALCIPSATHGVAGNGQMAVSAIVVEACRASLNPPARAIPESSRTETPPRPQVELRCSHGESPQIVVDEPGRPEAVRVRSCPDCGTSRYTTIVF